MLICVVCRLSEDQRHLALFYKLLRLAERMMQALRIVLVRSNTTRSAAGPRKLPDDRPLLAPSIRHRLVHAPAAVPIATSPHASSEEALHGRLGARAPPNTFWLAHPCSLAGSLAPVGASTRCWSWGHDR